MRKRKSKELKVSGIRWINQIPSEWSVKKLKYLVALNPVKSEVDKTKIKEVAFVPMEAVCEYGGFNNVTTKNIEEVYSGYTYFIKGDIVSAKITPCFENGKAAYVEGLENDIAFGTTELNVLRPQNNTYGKFIFYITISDYFLKIGESHMYGAGGQKRVPSGFIENLKIPVPSKPEQKAITTFLDHKTQAIDQLIKKKQQLIEKLKEKRQALITKAVTKGLIPDASMKDSGIEWLGEIPELWELKRLKFVMQTTPSKQEIPKKILDKEASFLPMEKVGEDGSLQLDQTKKISDVYSGYTYFQENDITIAKITPCFENGKGAVMKGLTNQVGFGTTELTVFRPKENIIPEYLHFILTSQAVRKIGESYMYGAGGQKRVPDSFFENLLIGIPSIEEQKIILNKLENEFQKINKASNSIEQQIEKLKEYRQSMISAAVTGKIDAGYEVDALAE